MSLNAVNASAPHVYSQTRPQETTYQSHEKLEVAYQDASGRAFNLSLERDVSYFSSTYDRSGSLPTSSEAVKKDLAGALRDAQGAVDGFKQLLHRLLKTVDKEYGDRFSFDPAAPSGSAQPQVDVRVVVESTSIRMDVVDPEYWSVEKTAGRLKDFAVSLYAGGDKKAHLEQMTQAMEEGYRLAAHAFGGTLPDIARQTVDAARKMLSEWAQASQQSDSPSSQQFDLVA